MKSGSSKRVVAVVLVVVLSHLSTTASSIARPANVGQCVEVDSQGYCLEWDVGSPGGGGSGGGSGGGGGEVVCFWRTISDPSSDPTVFYEFGLAQPPAGVTLVWQERVCNDGSAVFDLRWVVPVTPENLAQLARGEIVGRLPQPTVLASPPLGTAAIVEVPVFVEVSNWTGTINESECAGGLCVTLTATPVLRFSPGEPSSDSLQCAGPGTRFDANGPSPEAQAASDGACAHAYGLRTGAEGRPAAWPGLVSVTWTLSWSASSGATGTLPSVTRSTAVPRSVQEVQSVVVAGSTP